MTKTTFGMLVAGAMATFATGVLAPQTAAADDKACYRKHCGKSITGHEGQCGGTKVDGLTDQKACEAAGGAWTTATEAEAFKKKS
jgi:hypothetical protein